MKEETVVTIESSIKECETHILRLQRCDRLLAGFFPLTAEGFPGLDDEKIEHIDQFLYRFSKLQDSMGTRLLPSVFVYLEGDGSPRPFLDVLNRLEKLGILADVKDWQFFRTLRNNLAHDYPESSAQTVETLNLLYGEWRRLAEIFSRVRDHYREIAKRS